MSVAAIAIEAPPEALAELRKAAVGHPIRTVQHVARDALWVRGVASIGPNRASVFIHLMPLFGAVLAITFLGEEIASYHVLGAALVLVGVILSSRK